MRIHKKLQLVLPVSIFLAVTVSSGWTAPYDYPIADPIKATILSTPARYQAVLPKIIRAKHYETINIFPDRAAPEVFFYNEKLRYSIACQKKKHRLSL